MSNLSRYGVLALLIATNTMAQTRPIKPDLIDPADHFTPDGTTAEVNLPTLPAESKTETGKINGVKYRFYHSDGSGFVGGRPDGVESWDVGCSKDPMSDAKSCHMTMPSKNLWVWALPNGRYLINIGHDHYPGSTVSVRIDDGKPVVSGKGTNGSFGPAVSAKLIAKIRTASKVSTRYMEWPRDYWVDEAMEPYAFNEALQYITWAVNRIR